MVQHRKQRGGGAASGGGGLEKVVLRLLVVGAAIAVARKLYKLCYVRVGAGDVAIVFDTRRRAVFSTSADTDREHPSLSREVFHGNKKSPWAVLFPTSKSFVLRPPLPFFQVFTIPRAALSTDVGVAFGLTVESVKVQDEYLTMQLMITFYLDPKDVGRYLTLVGGAPPHEAIARAATDCMEEEVGDKSCGALLNPQRRDQRLVSALQQRLAKVLFRECGVRLKSFSIDAVELTKRPFT